MGLYCGGLRWGGWGGWGHMGWPGVGWVGPLFGGILLVGMIALLLVGAVWLARQGTGTRSRASRRRQDSLAIAQHRLAAGELTTTEFEEILDRLRERG